jgi:hypothetical protein
MKKNAMAMIKKVFENNGWAYEQEDDMFYTQLDMQNLTNVYYMVLVRDTEYLVYAQLPHKIPEAALPRMAEYLHRANFLMPFCNFELDYYEKEVRVKSYVDFELCKLSYGIVDNSMTYPIGMLQTHADSLMRVMYSNDNVEELYLKAID